MKGLHSLAALTGALLLSSAAQAQYKCAGAGGAVTFQQAPCASGERQTALRVPPPSSDAPVKTVDDFKAQSAAIDQRTAIRNAIESHQPVVSMTRAELDLAMGAPDKINAAQYGASNKDQLIYERDGRTLYDYVEDGRVTAIQNAESSRSATKKHCASPGEIRSIEIEISRFINRDKPQVQAELHRRLSEGKACL